MDLYQQVIHKSRYARYLDEQTRRESWEESVDRYINYLYKHTKNNTDISEEDLSKLYDILGATCER